MPAAELPPARSSSHVTGGLDDFLRSVGAAASVEHDKKRLLLLMPPYLHKRGDWQARQDWMSIAHSVS